MSHIRVGGRPIRRPNAKVARSCYWLQMILILNWGGGVALEKLMDLPGPTLTWLFRGVGSVGGLAGEDQSACPHRMLAMTRTTEHSLTYQSWQKLFGESLNCRNFQGPGPTFPDTRFSLASLFAWRWADRVGLERSGGRSVRSKSCRLVRRKSCRLVRSLSPSRAR